jgi:uncharacterized membrane protein YjjB (DUF3815 family)
MKLKTRQYIYKILIALAPLVGATGMVTEGVLQLSLILAAAILGVAGNALALNNPTPDDNPPQYPGPRSPVRGPKQA